MEVFYCIHDATHCRIWLSTWEDDQFKVITNEELEAFQAVAQLLGIEAEEIED